MKNNVKKLYRQKAELGEEYAMKVIEDLFEDIEKQEEQLRSKEQDRIIAEIDSKIDRGVFDDYNKQEAIDEIIAIIKNI